MAEPYTIRIFVLDGDPEGVKIVDRLNWTGIGVTFPRSAWPDLRSRVEFERAGVYILTGAAEGSDDDLPAVYVGQGDGVRDRIDSHFTKKLFWDWAYVFVSSNGGLNRGHITWLEYALLARADSAKRCRLDNINLPREPGLTEAEKADTTGFLRELLQIMPLLGVRVFEKPKPISSPTGPTAIPTVQPTVKDDRDTVVVPAQQEGFKDVFLGKNMWYAIRISGGMLPKIKYIAAYQSAPVSSITHYAPVDRIEPYGDEGKYKLVFSSPARNIGPIPFADASPGSMQGPRYTSLARLQAAKKVSDIFWRETASVDD